MFFVSISGTFDFWKLPFGFCKLWILSMGGPTRALDSWNSHIRQRVFICLWWVSLCLIGRMI